MLEKDSNLVAAVRSAKMKSCQTVGNYISMGLYPQDLSCGQTPIEWIVLDYDAEKNKTLLLSRYGLDTAPFSKDTNKYTWEECTLRTWLNNEFLNKAFNAKEKAAILNTNLDNSSSEGYNGWYTKAGKNTSDRIFLLSYAEAKRYLGVTANSAIINTKACVAPTDYAIARGAETRDDLKTADGALAGWWWLRTAGYSTHETTIVNRSGVLGICGYVDNGHGVVRPAFWLNLDSDIF